jgi:hypothetical protein
MEHGDDEVETIHRLRRKDRDLQRLIRLRENLIDFDILVDDARRDAERATHTLGVAIRDRDVAAVELAHALLDAEADAA